MPKKSSQLVRAVAEGASSVSAAEVEKFINAARRRRPGMSDAQLIVALERAYTRQVATSGAAAGAFAALPEGGRPAGTATTLADVGAFSTATARYVFAVASVHGIDIRDVDRRRELLLAAVAGNGGVGVVERLAGRTGGHWGRRLTKAVPIDAIDKVNGALAPRVVTKNGTEQGILVLGRIIPFGLGAGIGAAGNVLVARMTVAATRSAFGPLPKPDPPSDPQPVPAEPPSPVKPSGRTGT